jgi:prepilin-type N-terminal cleavage/methylation domain-containing protein
MSKDRSRGFTLTELAIALFIMSLLMVGLMYTLAAQTEQRNRVDTLDRLEEAREALIAFAIVNGRLPCPAAAPPNAPYNNAGGVGVESPGGGGACTDGHTGFLPARTLGYQPIDANGYALDAWNNPIRYAVSKDSSVAGSPDWNFTTAGSMKTNGVSVTPSDLVVCRAGSGVTASSCNTAPPVTNQSVVVAVLWSQGKNFLTSTAFGADENVNNKHRLPAVQNDTPVFVHTTPAPSGATGGEYDDLMVWLPVGVLYGRLIAAGVLP